MFDKLKEKIKHTSKETIKEEVKGHLPEIFAGASLILLVYLCVKVNGKPVNITVNVNGGRPYVF